MLFLVNYELIKMVELAALFFGFEPATEEDMDDFDAFMDSFEEDEEYVYDEEAECYCWYDEEYDAWYWLDEESGEWLLVEDEEEAEEA